MKGIVSRWGNKRTDLNRGALFVCLLSLVVLMLGCTEIEPGFVTTTDDSKVQVVDSDNEIIVIDESTGAISTIEFEHYRIHSGDTFTVLEVTDLGNGAVRDILVVTPDTTRWAHLVWEIEHELETSIQFYRGTTYTDLGTPITSLNRNGNSATTATTLIYHTPTITLVGTLLGTIQQGDGKKAGGSDRLANEFILEQNQSYLIKITNLTVNNNLIFMKLNWYEHTNR